MGKGRQQDGLGPRGGKLNGGCEVTASGHNVRITGTVDFVNFAEVRSAVELVLDDHDAIAVDLSGLDEANSVTVALLLAWFRAASREDKSLVLVDVPRDLRNIIDFSGLTELLPIGAGGENAQPGDSSPSAP